MRRAVVESNVLAELVKKKELQIAGGVYDLDSGKVEMISSGEK
jgi:carbonic anhydrase